MVTEKQINYLDFVSKAGYARSIDIAVWMEGPWKSDRLRNTQRAIEALESIGYIRGIGLGRRDRAFCVTPLGSGLLRSIGRGAAWTDYPKIPTQFEHHSLSLQSLAHLKAKLGPALKSAFTEHQLRSVLTRHNKVNQKIHDGLLHGKDDSFFYIEQENSRKTGEAARKLAEHMIGLLEYEKTSASIICYTGARFTKDEYNHEQALLGYLTDALVRRIGELPNPALLIPKLLLGRITLADRDSIGNIEKLELMQCWWDGFEIKIDGEIRDWPCTLEFWPRRPMLNSDQYVRRDAQRIYAFDENLSECFEVMDRVRPRVALCGYSAIKNTWICQVTSQEKGGHEDIYEFPIGNAGSELAFLFAAKALDDYRLFPQYF